MKISINAIRAFNERYHCSADPVPEGVDKLVERIGAQLAAVEETIQVGAKYAGVVIVKVTDCRKHENSDHLNVCTIDDGSITPDVKRDENGLVQVVCGAPNVRAGLTVVWLPPGSTVPSSYDSDPFVLSARELRGEMSNGMLASPKELALGDSHDGILEIDEDIAPGTLFADKYGLTNDVVIDMENKMFTHRPDCFGVLGVAREIAGIQGQKFTSPQWYRADATIDTPADSELRVEVRNEIPELVSRFVALPMSGITVGPSPVWLQVELSRLGMRSINSIVDLTNYHMLLTGQPLHAYDYDKVVAQDENADHATLVVRKPQEGEHLTLLNGKTIQPRDEAILIASASKAIGLGGVMGGADTEVDSNTRNIILECASFDMYSIRRTSMAHGLFSDAVTRFNKGQSPLQNMAVLAHIVDDIQSIVGGHVAGALIDDNHLSTEAVSRESLFAPVAVSVQFINERLGVLLSSDEMRQLLQNVAFDVRSNGMELTIKAPFWRTDIEIAEDIVEEVGRLYGYDHLPLLLPRRDLTPTAKCGSFELQDQIRSTLQRAGANEVLTYSFVHGNMIDKSDQDKELAFKLSNALSPDLQYYRLSITPSLLDKVHSNIKSGYDNFALFEIGKAHAVHALDDQGLPQEFDRLTCIFAADDKKASRSYSGAAYYQARMYLYTILRHDNAYSIVPFGGEHFESDQIFQQLAAPFEPSRSALIMKDSVPIGIIGEYKASVRKAFKLPVFSAGFEISLSSLQGVGVNAYRTLSRFPKIEQDISLRVSADITYRQLHDVVHDSLCAAQPPATSLTLSPLDIYQRDDDTDHKQITFRLSISSYDKTMTDGEVNALLDTAAASAASELGAERL